MEKREALNLLARGLPPDQVAGERIDLGKLAARLGEWAQLLKIVNGFLRDHVVKNREPLPKAISGANQRLDAKGLVAFDPRNEAVTRSGARSMMLRQRLAIAATPTDQPVKLQCVRSS
jgi:hypothetical protein